MGLNGEERLFLKRIQERGPQMYFNEHLRLSDNLTADARSIDSLIKRGYVEWGGVEGYTLTEASKEFLKAEKQNSDAYSKGMAAGKQMYANAVNRLRAKLSDQQVPTMLNRIYKHFIKKTNLTPEDVALLEEGKAALARPADEPAPGPFEFHINGKDLQSPRNIISYSELVEAAGLTGNPSMIVTQHNKDQGQRGFSLSQGGTVFLEPGWRTIVSAVHTDNA